MNTYDIRLIAMDMDGTLLNSRQEISTENLEALRLAEQKGVALAICSGRMPGDVSLYALESGLPKKIAILSLNGAYCLKEPLGQAYVNHLMDDQSLESCVQILTEAGINFACFAQNQIVVFDGADPLGEGAWGNKNEGEGAPTYHYGMGALSEIRKGGVNKVVCFEPDEKKFAILHRKLSDVADTQLTSSWPGSIEIMPVGIGKGLAVRELAESLGIGRDQVMAIGDFDNDITMIEYAGLGVAMGNATESVKGAAKHITLSNDEDGVAHAIHRFVLS